MTEASMARRELIIETQLSTRANRALVKNDVHTVQEMQALLAEQGPTHIRTRMFGIGRVTADEILRFLYFGEGTVCPKLSQGIPIEIGEYMGNKYYPKI